MGLETFKAIVPLLAVLLTAVLSGYVVPRITRSWQDHQKELEMKTSLVEEVSDAVLQFIIAMQFAERKVSTQEAFDEAYRRWEVKRAVLIGKLRVYFRDPTIAQEFESFSDAVSDFYALTGIYHPEYRARQIEKLKSYFGNAATNWERLSDQEERRDDFFNWFFAWWDLRQQVLLRKDMIIRKLLAAPIDFLRSIPQRYPVSSLGELPRARPPNNFQPTSLPPPRGGGKTAAELGHCAGGLSEEEWQLRVAPTTRVGQMPLDQCAHP
jgi:hypothetical protein